MDASLKYSIGVESHRYSVLYFLEIKKFKSLTSDNLKLPLLHLSFYDLSYSPTRSLFFFFFFFLPHL